jgi:hypothetical protein
MIFNIYIQVIKKKTFLFNKKNIFFSSDEQNNSPLRESNSNSDEHHLQVPRLKQLPIDGIFYALFFFTTKHFVGLYFLLHTYDQLTKE